MRGSPRFAGVLMLFVGVVAGLGLPGCAGKRESQENPAAAHLRRIAGAYDMVLYHKRRPPRSVEDLKPFLKEDEQGDPDVFLRSPNDGQPYEIVWGVNLDNEENLSAILAHEKNGVEGKRYVITIARIVKEMTEEDFKRATFPKVKGGAAGK